MRRCGEESWMEGSVPGSVYGDLLKACAMEDPFWKDNENEAVRLMEEDYEYVTEFDCDREILKSDRVVLRFDGIDTVADIYVNGILLGDACNMHRIWEFEIKDCVRPSGNELRVVLHSPNRYIREAFEKCRTLGNDDTLEGFVHLRKAHYMFGWDWGAHLPDAGIFRPVRLLGVREARLDNVLILQHHDLMPEAADEQDRIRLGNSAVSQVRLQLGITVEAPDEK